MDKLDKALEIVRRNQPEDGDEWKELTYVALQAIIEHIRGWGRINLMAEGHHLNHMKMNASIEVLFERVEKIADEVIVSHAWRSKQQARELREWCTAEAMKADRDRKVKEWEAQADECRDTSARRED